MSQRCTAEPTAQDVTEFMRHGHRHPRNSQQQNEKDGAFFQAGDPSVSGKTFNSNVGAC